MKRFFFFLIASIFSCDILAQEFSTESPEEKTLENDVANYGLLKKIVENDLYQSSTSGEIKISGLLVTDIKFDDNYQSTNRKDQYKETVATGRIFSNIDLGKHFFINSHLRLAQSQKSSETARRNALPQGGGDRTFEDEGILIRSLAIGYKDKNYAILAGKFDLNFGTAWQWNRGIWTYEIANNYRQIEKLGFNGEYKIGDVKKNGEYQFGFAAFTNDRKNLDNSIITKRDSNSKSNATPGDTRSLKSYLASLDINFDFGCRLNKKNGLKSDCRESQKEKLSYHFGYVNLAVNSQASSIAPTKIANQKSFVAGMNYKYPLLENLAFDSLLEYVQIKNFGGDSDISENYLTFNIITKLYQNWNVTLGYAKLANIQAYSYGYDQNLSEISFGYDFNKVIFFDRISLQTGYKQQRNNYKTSLETQNVFGILLRFYKNF